MKQHQLKAIEIEAAGGKYPFYKFGSYVQSHSGQVRQHIIALLSQRPLTTATINILIF